jgi:hypothetical protein
VIAAGVFPAGALEQIAHHPLVGRRRQSGRAMKESDRHRPRAEGLRGRPAVTQVAQEGRDERRVCPLVAQRLNLSRSAAQEERLQAVIRVMTSRVEVWNAYHASLEVVRGEDDPMPEFPRDILDAISAVPPMSESTGRPPIRVECYDQRAFDAAWNCAIGRATAAKNQRGAATELKIARLWASATDIGPDDRERGVIDSLVAWVERHEPDHVNRFLFVSRAQFNAKADIEWLGLERATTVAQIRMDACERESQHRRSGPHRSAKPRLGAC